MTQLRARGRADPVHWHIFVRSFVQGKSTRPKRLEQTRMSSEKTGEAVSRPIPAKRNVITIGTGAGAPPAVRSGDKKMGGRPA